MDFVEFVNIIYQKSGIRKGYYIVLTDVKYRSRYSFSMIFVSQKSQFKTQNSQLKILKRPPLEKNRGSFLQNLTSLKMPENAVFAQFNVR